jgi:hypothetical protein
MSARRLTILPIRGAEGPGPVREAAQARMGGGIPGPVGPTGPESMAPGGRSTERSSSRECSGSAVIGAVSSGVG